MLFNLKVASFKKELPKFFSTFQKEPRQLNLILLSLFFLTFPNQNAYQAMQPTGERPLVRQVDFKLPEMKMLPLNQTGKAAPYLTAKSALVIDLPSKTVIFDRNPDLKLFPASTTKIMTALTATDYYQPNDVLTVKSEWNVGQVTGFKSGEKLTFENLLYSMLVGSGNDAAYILAENYPGGLTKFIEAMNSKAQNLNLKETNFADVAGIDTAGHYTTVHDLAIITVEALKNPLISKVVSTNKVEIFDAEHKYHYLLESTNKLLGQLEGVKGVKTGWTENAGECLVAYTQREKGEIVTVVLGSSNRFGETRALIEWVYQNFQWQPIAATRQ